MSDRLLITGGAGFIGANFVHYWLKNHSKDKVIVLDALTYAGNMENLSGIMKHPAFEFIKADICDTDRVEQIMRDCNINVLVHFAAESHVDRSISGPD